MSQGEAKTSESTGWQRFRHWNPFRRRTSSIPDPIRPQPSKEEGLPEMETSEAESPRGIATILADMLKGADITPPKLSRGECGPVAIFHSNEDANDFHFFSYIREKHPADGYVVGVGVGMSLVMVYGYPERIKPKGFVLADINPQVVTAGKLFVMALKDNPDFELFRKNFLEIDRKKFELRRLQMIDQEAEPTVREVLQNMTDEQINYIHRCIIGRPFFNSEGWTSLNPLHNLDPFSGFFNGLVGIELVIRDKYKIFRDLALSDNIAIVYADFTNPNFIAATTTLPGFQDGTNIIYLSNIAGFMGPHPNYDTIFAPLKKYEQTSHAPIIVDAISAREGRDVLRARRSLPHYSHEELNRYLQFFMTPVLFDDEI